jgi:hypothetical protein
MPATRDTRGPIARWRFMESFHSEMRGGRSGGRQLSAQRSDSHLDSSMLNGERSVCTPAHTQRHYPRLPNRARWTGVREPRGPKRNASAGSLRSAGGALKPPRAAMGGQGAPRSGMQRAAADTPPAPIPSADLASRARSAVTASSHLAARRSRSTRNWRTCRKPHRAE